MTLTVTQPQLPGMGASCEPDACVPLHGRAGDWRPCIRCGNPTWVFPGKNSLRKARIAVEAADAA